MKLRQVSLQQHIPYSSYRCTYIDGRAKQSNCCIFSVYILLYNIYVTVYPSSFATTLGWAADRDGCPRPPHCLQGCRDVAVVYTWLRSSYSGRERSAVHWEGKARSSTTPGGRKSESCWYNSKYLEYFYHVSFIELHRWKQYCILFNVAKNTICF